MYQRKAQAKCPVYIISILAILFFVFLFSCSNKGYLAETIENFCIVNKD